MKDQLISFETAKLAKEKGFDGSCYDCYNIRGMQYSNGWCEYIDDDEIYSPFTRSELIDNDSLAPTQSLLQKWLREVHQIVIDLNCTHKNYKKTITYTWNIISFDDELSGREGALKKIHNMRNSSEMYYEEALEKGLQEALKLI